jgi:hypothetical protein
VPTQILNDLSDLPKVVSAHQIKLHSILTVQRIFHFLRDGQHLPISVEALVVPVTRVSEFSVRASFDCLIEVIDGVPCNLRFGMLALSESEGGLKRTIGFAIFSRVSLLLHILSVRLMGWISPKDAAGFVRVRFPVDPRPTVGIVLDGRMSATCRLITACVRMETIRQKMGTYLSVRWERILTVAFRG